LGLLVEMFIVDERNIINMLQFAILKFMYWGFITYVINLRFLRTSNYWHFSEHS